MIELSKARRKDQCINCFKWHEDTIFVLHINSNVFSLCQNCLDEVNREIEAAQAIAYTYEKDI